MASNWRVSVTLIDQRGIKTTMNFLYAADDITLADEFSAANTVMQDFLTDLALVTNANVYRSNLTLVGAADATTPASADVTDVAFVIAYLSGTGQEPKFHTLRIPAPVAGIFSGDGVTIDKTDADLISYVANFLDPLLQVSDGEHVVADIDSGIKGGSWASAKKSPSAVQAAT